MKLLAVNGSPRRNMNTAQLMESVVEGAKSNKAEAELVHLRDYKFSGCVSCFRCKEVGGPSYGRCILGDELKPVLDKAHEADILVLGTPFYFGVECSLMRSFQERLWNQYILYTNKKPPLSPRKKNVALLYTMNIREDQMEPFGHSLIVEHAKKYMELLFGHCRVFICADTKQVPDYSRYEMDMFNAAAKDRRQRELFPHDQERAFALGALLVN